MCLLSYYPSGKQPDLGRLIAGASVNRDGFGYAIAHPKEGMVVSKSVSSPGAFIEEFGQRRAELPEGPAIFHARLGTGGHKTVWNCHPFELGDDNLTVVAHNGMLWRQAKGARDCDTRAFVNGLMAKHWSRLDNMHTQVTMERWLTRYNKLVVLTVNPRYAFSSYLFNEAAGIWDNGEWHSNSDYLSRVDVLHRLNGGTVPVIGGDNEHPRELCPICWERGWIDHTRGVCGNCNYCVDCCEEADMCCLCHVPASAIRRAQEIG